MTTTEYFPGHCTTSFFLVSLSLYTVPSLVRLGITPSPTPGDLRGGCECALDYIFLWFPEFGALYCLFPAHLIAVPRFRFPCFLMTLLGRDLAPLTKIFAK